jgi:NAD(P)-dependent dehydrogenase (short-subunit alcohol dehydrogenase family)
MSRDKEFLNKVALVTGAGTGMGAATAVLLAERGANVVLAGRREQPLRDVAESITAAGGQALVVPGDVSDPAAAARLVEATVAQFGALHYGTAGRLPRPRALWLARVTGVGTRRSHAPVLKSSDLTCRYWRAAVPV